MTKVIDPKTGQNNAGKECTKCGEWKVLSEFHTDKKKTDGLTSQCGMCRNAHKQLVRRSIVIPDGRGTAFRGKAPATELLPTTRAEAISSGSTKYFTGKPCGRGHLSPRYTKSQGCIECERTIFDNEKHLAAQARSREKHRDKRAEESRRFRRENPLQAKAHSAKYRANNREKIRENSKKAYRDDPQAANSRWHTRRAKLKGAEGTHTSADIARINAAQGHICVYCGISTKEIKSVDHIVPLSRGGSNWPDNLQILCPKCNRSKADRTDDEFRFLLENGLTAVNDNKLIE